MRCKAIAAAVLLLLAQSSFGQEPPPLLVETLKPVPTVVKTGEPFVQVYRVRFPDLVGEGKEIIVLEDRMAPENVAVRPFEAVSVDVVKRRVNDEHIWDFAYTFRIVNPAKMTYRLPSFSFYWLVRDLGEAIEETDVELFSTDEVSVSYVTTVTTDPVLDIRDAIELGSFSTRATLLRAIAWTIAPLPLVVWIVMFIRIVRRPKLSGQIPVKHEEEFDALQAGYLPLSAGRARRQLRRRLQVLSALDHGQDKDGQALLDLERSLVISLKDLLRAELPELNPGDSPKDIRVYIEHRVKEGSRKDALMTLASRMVAYQSGLEKGMPSPVDHAGLEARLLRQSVIQLRPHARAWARLKDAFGRLRERTWRA